MPDSSPQMESVPLTMNECKLLAKLVDEQVLKLRRSGFRHDDSAVAFLEQLRAKLWDACRTLQMRGLDPT